MATSSFKGTVWKVVWGTNVFVRSGPDRESSKVAELAPSSVVIETARQGDWIQHASSHPLVPTGWTLVRAGENVVMEPVHPAPQESVACAGTKWVVVWNTNVFVRLTSHRSSAKIAELSPGAEITELARDGLWIRHAKGWSLSKAGNNVVLQPVGDTTHAGTEWRVVWNTNCFVRAEPSRESLKVCEITPSSTVIELARDGDWIRHSLGWTQTRANINVCLFEVPKSQQLPKWKVIWQTAVFIRAAPDREATQVGELPPGAIATELSRVDDWIRHPQGWTLTKAGSTICLVPVSDDVMLTAAAVPRHAVEYTDPSYNPSYALDPQSQLSQSHSAHPLSHISAHQMDPYASSPGHSLSAPPVPHAHMGSKGPSVSPPAAASSVIATHRPHAHVSEFAQQPSLSQHDLSQDFMQMSLNSHASHLQPASSPPHSAQSGYLTPSPHNPAPGHGHAGSSRSQSRASAGYGSSPSPSHAAMAMPVQQSVPQPQQRMMWKVIWNSSVFVRAGPSRDSAKVGELPSGSRVMELDRADDWIRHAQGWTLTQAGHNTCLVPDYKIWRVVWSTSVYVRNGPSRDSPKVGELMPGARVMELERVGEWLRHSQGWTLARAGHNICLICEDEEVTGLSNGLNGSQMSASVSPVMGSMLSSAQAAHPQTLSPSQIGMSSHGAYGLGAHGDNLKSMSAGSVSLPSSNPSSRPGSVVGSRSRMNGNVISSIEVQSTSGSPIMSHANPASVPASVVNDVATGHGFGNGLGLLNGSYMNPLGTSHPSASSGLGASKTSPGYSSLSDSFNMVSVPPLSSSLSSSVNNSMYGFGGLMGVGGGLGIGMGGVFSNERKSPLNDGWDDNTSTISNLSNLNKPSDSAGSAAPVGSVSRQSASASSSQNGPFSMFSGSVDFSKPFRNNVEHDGAALTPAASASVSTSDFSAALDSASTSASAVASPSSSVSLSPVLEPLSQELEEGNNEQEAGGEEQN